MLLEERHKHILSQLSKTGSVRTAELVTALKVSSETVRKDLEMMASEGLLDRVHGGAMQSANAKKAPGNTGYVAFDERQLQNFSMKQVIAQSAATLVREGQSVALDAGTSSFELAKALTKTFDHLTVITNSVKIAVQLVENSNFVVICTGGVLTGDEYSFVSDFATLILDKINIDIMFLTASGITASGLTDQRIPEIKIQDKMRQVSEKVVVVADSSKFGVTSFVKLCDLEDIDTIITDSHVDSALAAELGQRVKLMVV
ncbi:MAG: DeoR/GlpR family DNA-binding transcription regulator [Oscillospiraceae bacterium]